MLLILFVLALAVVVWVTLKPTWLPTAPENKVTDAISKNAARASESAKSLSSSVTEKSGSWLDRLKVPFKKKPDQALQFKAWASQLDTEHAELSTWLSALSDEASAQLANELVVFCRNQNLELAWLFDEKTDVDLKSGLQELVVFYCRAIVKAANAKPLAAYQRWQAAPTLPENRSFTQDLYTRLVSSGLVSVPGELLLASEKERESHVIQAIQTAVVEHRAAVMTLVSEMYAVSAAEPVAAAKPEATVKKTKKTAAAAAPVVIIQPVSEA